MTDNVIPLSDARGEKFLRARRDYEAIREAYAAVRRLVEAVGRGENSNPLLAAEQLRGRILRHREHCRCAPVVVKCLDQVQEYCDAVHHIMRDHPDIDRWRDELVAYERAEFRKERAARTATDMSLVSGDSSVSREQPENVSTSHRRNTVALSTP